MLEFEWIVSLAAIIVVDILLAGDNAVVIAMAARRLPPEHRKRAIWGGTALAILVRVSLVFFVTFLLRLPGLQIVGGSLLLIVAWRMTHPEESRAPGDDKSAANLREAIMAIVVADTVMGLDNILAVAGAARGDFTLVIVGFLLSIPIMVAGSFFILRMLEKRPWLALAGGRCCSPLRRECFWTTRSSPIGWRGRSFGSGGWWRRRFRCRGFCSLISGRIRARGRRPSPDNLWRAVAISARAQRH